MGFSPEPAVPAHSRDRMLRKRPWVIGVDLNRYEFTAAALRDLGPAYVRDGVSRSEQMFSGLPPKPRSFGRSGGASIRILGRKKPGRQTSGVTPATRAFGHR
jgi:hypothetical protein